MCKSLEEKQCKEALLLSKRCDLAQHAANLVDRIESMQGPELHKSLTVIHNEGHDLPMDMKLRLLQRRCLEDMQADVVGFISVWSPWTKPSRVGAADGEAEDDTFNPLNPTMLSLVDIIADKQLNLTMMEVDSDDEEAKQKSQTLEESIQREWKAREGIEISNE